MKWMILGVSEILRLVREKKLVENLSERELTNPEGAGFDFRIGALYRVKSKHASRYKAFKRGIAMFRGARMCHLWRFCQYCRRGNVGYNRQVSFDMRNAG